MRLGRACLLILPALWLTGCSPDFELMAKNRLEQARKNQGDIQIAVFQDRPDSTYLNGIALAVEDINRRSGKLLGRRLSTVVEQDGDSFEATQAALRRVAANPNISAVLGHSSSSVAVPASVAYERSQLIFIPPFSTAQGLTSHDFHYVFRMTPNARIMAGQLADVARLLGYQKVVILYARDDTNREQAFLFEDAAIQAGIQLVQNSSFFDKESNHRPLIAQFNSKSFDAVFLAAPTEAAGDMARQLREMGIKQPILGTDDLALAAYPEHAGNAAENTIVPSVYRPGKGNPRSGGFIRRYRAKYTLAPDADAAQGYDSVMLLAAAIDKAGSTIAPLLSSTLHYLPAWIGVTGLHAYSPSGELRGKKYVFNAWQRGHWQPLPAIHVPYLLGRFQKDLAAARAAQARQADPVAPANPAGKAATVFTEVFARRLAVNDHKRHLLELAQAILQFRRIGVVYEDTEAGRLASDYPIVSQVAGDLGLTLTGCALPFSKLDGKHIAHALTACYAKLSLSTDSQYITAYDGVDPVLTAQLSRILPLFKSSSVGLDAGQAAVNPSLVLDKRADVDPLGLGAMQVYRNLLNGSNVQELAERLQGLPDIAINLGDLQKLGIPDNAVLQLSPDAFLGLDPEPEATEARP
mgnify:CR=1 FL=1